MRGFMCHWLNEPKAFTAQAMENGPILVAVYQSLDNTWVWTSPGGDSFIGYGRPEDNLTQIFGYLENRLTWSELEDRLNIPF